jgi:23S rRNA (uridine2552-2'-O)-methyltransferase
VWPACHTQSSRKSSQRAPPQAVLDRVAVASAERPYVAEAQRLGYRSRAAFKLIEVDDRFRLLRPGPPGGRSGLRPRRLDPGRRRSRRSRRCRRGDRYCTDGAGRRRGNLHCDIHDPDGTSAITTELGDPADVVLSDMAPSATGHAAADHLRIVALAEAAFSVASEILRPGGAFVAKVFHGGAEGALLAQLKRVFAEVRHVKPPASRAESAETYVIAKGFRGRR